MVDYLNYEAITKTVVRLLIDNRQHALTLGIGVGALIQRGGRAVAGMLTIATAGGS